MGFLSTLINHQDDFEVQRIIKALVNAEEIASILEKLSNSVTTPATNITTKDVKSTKKTNNG